MDEGAPAGIMDSFRTAGHDVIPFGDVLEAGSKDDLVCATAVLNKAALIAVDKDMKYFKKRYGQPEGERRFKNLHLIHFACSGVQAVKRAPQAMSFIEHEWRFACDKNARELWVEIGPHHIRSNR